MKILEQIASFKTSRMIFSVRCTYEEQVIKCLLEIILGNPGVIHFVSLHEEKRNASHLGNQG